MRGKRSIATWETTPEGSYPFDFSHKKFWGIFELKERWSLSLHGWSLVAGIVVLVPLVLVWQTYPFLAVTHRVNANVLVVEGWVHEYAIGAALEEFQGNHYQRVFTHGRACTRSWKIHQ